MKGYQYLFVVFILTLMQISLQSCDDNRVFYGKSDIEETWAYSDTLIYKFEITDTFSLYRLSLDVEWNIEKYPYQNCYLNFSTQYPDGQNQSELLNIDLTDEIGLVHGDCSGSNCEVDIILQSSIRFNQLGTYQIKINQSTRTEHLPGIKSMAIDLERKEK